jgi:hypothetical protein
MYTFQCAKYVQDTDKMANVMLTIRVPQQLRDDFTALAEANDLTVSQILRAVMREYVAGRRILSPVSDRPSAQPALTTPARPEPAVVPVVVAPVPIEAVKEKPTKATTTPAAHDDTDFMAGVRGMLGMDDE